MKDSPMLRRFASNSSWATLAFAASRTTSVLATILIARIVGKTVLGEFGILMSSLGMFSVMASFGLNLTMAKYVSEFRTKEPGLVGSIVGLALITVMTVGLLVSLAVIALANPIAYSLMNAAHLVGPLYIMAVMLTFHALSGVQAGILMGLESFRLVYRLNMIIGLSHVVMVTSGAYLAGLTGLVTMLTLNTIFAAVLQHMAIRRALAKAGISICYRTCLQAVSILWRFCTPSFLSSIVIIPVTWICNVMLINQSGGYGEMGAFSIGLQWFNFMIFIPRILGQAIFPIMNERAGAMDYATAIKAWRSSIHVVAAITCLLCLLGSFFSGTILGLYGDDFERYSGMLSLMFVAGAMQSILDAVAQIIVTRTWMWRLFLMNTGFAFVCLVGSIHLVHMGAFGLAWARVGAYTAHSLWIAAVAVLASKFPKTNNALNVAL